MCIHPYQVDSQSREGLEDPVVTPNSLVNLSNINTIDISSGTCLASLDDGNIQHRPKFKDTPSTFEVGQRIIKQIIIIDNKEKLQTTFQIYSCMNYL